MSTLPLPATGMLHDRWFKAGAPGAAALATVLIWGAPNAVQAQRVEFNDSLAATFSGRLTVHGPVDLAGTYVAAPPSRDWSDATGLCPPGLGPVDLVWAVDSTGSDLACDQLAIEFVHDLTGRAALIRRGECNFQAKVWVVDRIGAAAGALIFNDRIIPSDPPVPDDDSTSLVRMSPWAFAKSTNIPPLFVSRWLGLALRDAFLAGQTVQVSLAVALPDSTFYCPPVATDPGPEDAGLQLRVAPNPASSQTTLHIALTEPGHVRVSVIDMLGRVLAVSHDGALAAGAFSLTIDTAEWPPGTYAIRVYLGGRSRYIDLSVVR